MLITSDFDCTVCGEMVELKHQRDESPSLNCPNCGNKSLKKAYVGCPPYLNRYSPMHPRRSRGMGGVREELTWAQKKRIEKQENLRKAWLNES